MSSKNDFLTLGGEEKGAFLLGGSAVVVIEHTLCAAVKLVS